MTHMEAQLFHDADPPLSVYERSLIQARKAGWTAAQDDRLAESVEDGLSLRRCAARLGKTVGSTSRRIKALGLKLKTPPMPRLASAVKPKEPAFDRCAMPEPFVVGVAYLESHHCRFICNDDMSEPAYCGLPIDGADFSFCSGHRLICCRPPKTRRS